MCWREEPIRPSRAALAGKLIDDSLRLPIVVIGILFPTLYGLPLTVVNRLQKRW